MDNSRYKFRAWDGFRMINRTLFDRNWYTCTKDERLAKEALPRDKNTLKVMQYTGLKDKNGKEIYCGDLLQSPYFDDPIEVSWNNDDACFESMGCVSEWSSCEVIGNIYEHGDLLDD